MNPLVGHLVVSSIGLFVIGLAVGVLRRVFARDPVLSYRMLVAVMLGALVLPALQWSVQGKVAGYQDDVRHLAARTSPSLELETWALLAQQFREPPVATSSSSQP